MFTAVGRVATSRLVASRPAFEVLASGTTRRIALRPAPFTHRSFAVSALARKQDEAAGKTKKTAAATKKKSTTKAKAAPKKKETKAAPKKKPVKKEVTPEQKEKLEIKRLKEQALHDDTKYLAQHPWALYVAENFPRGEGNRAHEVVKRLAGEFTALPESDKERLRAAAAANALVNKEARKKWITSHPPEVIYMANLARRRLTKKLSLTGRTRNLAPLEDDRLPKRSHNAYNLFLQNRINQLSDKPIRERFSQAGKEWHALSDTERQPFIEAAQAEAHGNDGVLDELKKKGKEYWRENSTVKKA